MAEVRSCKKSEAGRLMSIIIDLLYQDQKKIRTSLLCRVYRFELPVCYNTGASHALRNIFIRLLCFSGKLISLSL